jgi:predicted Zn finger-like uncharacterized protein
MVVTCDHCGARYRLPEDRIEGRGARITCPRCQHVFVVYRQEEGDVATKAVDDEPIPDVHDLNFKSVGILGWKVKVAIGLVYDFSDYKTLRKYLNEGRVTHRDNLSHNGTDWVEISSITDLQQHFVDVYLAAKNRQKVDAKAAVAAENAAREAVDADAIADELLSAVSSSGEPETADDLTALSDDADAGASEPETNDIADDLLAAVEAAAAAEDGDDASIDLDMDSLLEEATKEVETQKPPPAARRGREQAAVKAVAKTGSEEESGHQFVDPFEALKQQRQARGGSQNRRKGTSKKVAKAAAEKKQKDKKIVILGLLAAVAAVVALVALQEEPTAVPNPAAVKQKQADMDKATLTKRKEEARAKMKAKLNEALQDVEVEEIEFYETQDEQLIVKVPEHIKNAGKVMPGGAVSDRVGVPKNPDGSVRAKTAQDHVAAGDMSARAGQWDQSVGSFEKAIAMQPGNANIRARYGRVLYQQGNQGEAEAQLRQALSQGSNPAHKYLGHMAKEQGDISGANSHYQAYLRSNPADEKAIQALVNQMNP